VRGNIKEIKSVSGSTNYDIDFKQHLKVINGNLCYLHESGLWMRSCHRLGVGAIEYEKAIIKI
jgi:hypothetical protein